MNLGILQLFRILLIFIFLQNLNAKVKSFDFDFIKKGEQNENTLLIIGGIQGDEPGAFMAASLIATHYDIKKGSVWVIPNLNFYSIIKRSRGPYGDMNRKFAALSKDDPDYDAVERIKKYIKDDEVKLILNLHDGSGFYREKYVNNNMSPRRWGQCSIVDQSTIDIDKYGNLEEISTKVVEGINTNLIRERDMYHVKNTQTRLGDKEMEKTLTYYAINNGKAAFANEASKELNLQERVYYHLLAIEEYMKIMGIEFERKFDISTPDIKNVIDHDIFISFYDEKIKLPLSKVRKLLKYFPINKDGDLSFTASNPLMTIVKEGKEYIIHYGNRKLAKLHPDYIKFIEDERYINMSIDGITKSVKFGDIIYAKDNFNIESIPDLRVNVIGYVSKTHKNEVGIDINRKEIAKRFSIDKDGNLFRIEFYNGDKFAGMILLGFEK
ncbi:deacylase [Poseidonibacter lekithochrous]|uniref:M99 family carboxypeptidase catalytic domain-containing protein n=1 Tax=Poseidonibacter TaxID=2321187 RepID=UPI001C0A046D|nr:MULTISPECIES: M99 family carboxypeptidase catalytic domain-containing protein [Poseidonibacter]MBU3014643.1 deacylase [Poseidonibacter lekithochrous]MDO6827941.1 M99 family carboxypeptidase catalytic domain-containing protein [Poseidonibacter sp. 1_MG-2023]